MEQYRTRLINGFIISNMLFQVIFLVTCFFFSDMISYGSPYFRITTHEEVLWVRQYATDYNIVYYTIFPLLRNSIILINIIGFCLLFSKKRNLLPVPWLWKIVIPAVGILVYIPCFYYIKYYAPHYYMYLELVPAEIFSLVSLGLIIAGKWHERLKEKC